MSKHTSKQPVSPVVAPVEKPSRDAPAVGSEAWLAAEDARVAADIDTRIAAQTQSAAQAEADRVAAELAVAEQEAAEQEAAAQKAAAVQPIPSDPPPVVVEEPAREIEQNPHTGGPFVGTVVREEPTLPETFVPPSQPSATGEVTVLALTTVGENGQRFTTTKDGTFIQM